MSDNYDDLITEAFGEFSAINAPAVKAKGTQAVHTTYTHRRRVRLTTFSVLGALLIAAPIAAFAANPRGNSAPPIQPAASASASAAVKTPDQVITAAELVAAKLTLPKFDDKECPTRLGDKEIKVRQVVLTNLDADTALETAALIDCSSVENSHPQVVGFDRDISGKIFSLGRVIPVLNANWIAKIVARPAGGITATMVDDPVSPEPGDIWDQDREYAWDGAKFAQVGGPEKFLKPTLDLTLKCTALKLGKVVNGKRTGTITLTVTNKGPEVSNNFDVEIEGNVEIANQADLGYPGLAVGESKVFTLSITVDASWAEPTLRVTLYSVSNDKNYHNNYVDVPVSKA